MVAIPFALSVKLFCADFVRQERREIPRQRTACHTSLEADHDVGSERELRHPQGLVQAPAAAAARNYAVARLAADVGLRINEARMLDLDDVRWELGRFGKLNVRHGKGSRRRGPKPRLVPLINGADRGLRWFIEDVRGQFGADHTRPGAPLFPSERVYVQGSGVWGS